MNLSLVRPDEVTAQQWGDLLLLARYRVLTLELLRQLRRGEEIDAIRARLDRLVTYGWAVKSVLADGSLCYALGSKALRLFGRHHRSGFGFTSDGLLQHLGIAAFCVLGGFERLLPDEFHERWPRTERRGLQGQNYCLDRADGATVCWAVVDHATDVKRIPGKVSKVITARWDLPGFQQLIARSQFKVVVITAVERKREQIAEILSQQPPTGIEASAVCIPWLLQFLLSRDSNFVVRKKPQSLGR